MDLIQAVSSQPQVRAIGLSGGKKSTPAPGEGDMDYFIYCTELPPEGQRQAILSSLSSQVREIKVNCLQSSHWGNADYLLLDGVDTWLMYFTIDETVKDLEEVLAGKFLDRIDGEYYPIGRCAMFQSMLSLYDPDSFIASLKKLVEIYPEELAHLMLEEHSGALDDREDFDRAVSRRDVLFYHFALEIALDHFLQALFALNRTYFPSRKRSFEYIERFGKKPENCKERLLQVIHFGGSPETLDKSHKIWLDLAEELVRLCS